LTSFAEKAEFITAARTSPTLRASLRQRLGDRNALSGVSVPIDGPRSPV
jgi:hypothetical protein